MSEQFLPRRGDAVERWLFARRGAVVADAAAFLAIDDLIEHYANHADTSTPLDRPLPVADASQKAVAPAQGGSAGSGS
jgi:hypothetical protein